MQPPPLPAGTTNLRGFLIAMAICIGPILVFGLIAQVAERLHINGLATVAFAFLGFALLADAVLLFVALARAFSDSPGAWGMLSGAVLFWIFAIVYTLKQMSIL
jgi:hypothetical protein